ncbi:(2,3-dihydroxybenzoyl)adenylate synthase [Denitrobacterium detoxificans]|jgi:2,3-dihydroxybenzoate-AMP ligase|uniref:(2,3-dihydroxybenzoyl)adenylate synthase n=1 Tax=Denitrobacterium detoxificans TaxID=79604 RepID=UPI0026EA3A5D|nr:AMP-binding protein [Denitrobacterium detoxificans]
MVEEMQWGAYDGGEEPMPARGCVVGPHPEHVLLEGVVPFPAEFAERYRERGYWKGETIADMFFGSVRSFAHNVAVVDGEEEITYAKLGERVLRLAGGLSRLGIGRGDRVVVHLPNVAVYFDVVFALFELGAIPVFALQAHRRTEIEYFCSFAQAKAYITIDSCEGFDHAALAREIAACVPSVEHALVVDTQDDCREFGKLYGEPLSHQERCNPADVAFLQLSGGTTGKPKLIPRTHDDYLYTIRESARICGLSSESVHLIALPIAHNYTMSSPGILGCVYAGAKMVLAPSGSPDVAFPLISKHHVTSSSLVPPVALLWLNSSVRDEWDLSSLQVLQVGGAKLSQEAARRVKPELGCTLQQVFGMAEGLVNYTRLNDPESLVVSSQGLRISPDDEVRVVDDDGVDLPAGVPGNLLTRGPYTIRGYYCAPEVNERDFTLDGFYCTGDIVSRDERGYLTVTGRKKDQINRGGEKVSPEEIENLLLSHEAIHDASVVGVRDQVLGEKVKAFVVLREDVDPGSVSPFKLKKFLRQKGIAGFKIPDEFEIVDEFPETFVGKTSKRAQRES